ncbi:MAG: hypothetical protein PWP47_161 [Synergistaceae bacterium]|nr:hypothetical protein [Synergistaceae bacterium]
MFFLSGFQARLFFNPRDRGSAAYGACPAQPDHIADSFHGNILSPRFRLERADHGRVGILGDEKFRQPACFKLPPHLTLSCDSFGNSQLV